MGLTTDVFLDRFSSQRRFSIPHPFMWEVTVDGTVGLVSEIQSVLNDYGLGGNHTVKNVDMWGNGGKLVAQEVTLPSESYEVASIGQDNRGGWMPGYGVTQRTDFLSRNMTINYLETADDIETSFFRPWTIAVGSAGLLNTKLRSTVIVTQYTRDNRRRKTYQFDRAFPTNVEGYTLNYGDGEFIVKTVTFAFHSYKINNRLPLE